MSEVWYDGDRELVGVLVHGRRLPRRRGDGVSAGAAAAAAEEDMLADAEGAGDGGAAQPELVVLRGGVRAQGRGARGLGDNVLAVAVKE